MVRNRWILSAFALILAGTALVSAQTSRTIMEKKAWYTTPDNNIGETRFWSIYLGLVENIPLERKIYGEGMVTVDAALNFQFLSSGYIQGNGYSNKGKVECLPTMLISNENGERRVILDSIDYIYDFGFKVALTNGEKGDFIISAEGHNVEPTRFMLRKYNLRKVYGEEVLDDTAEEIIISAIAFSKEGIQRAKKEPLE